MEAIIHGEFLIVLDESFSKFACQVFRYTVYPQNIDSSMGKLAKIHKGLRTKPQQ